MNHHRLGNLAAAAVCMAFLFFLQGAYPVRGGGYWGAGYTGDGYQAAGAGYLVPNDGVPGPAFSDSMEYNDVDFFPAGTWPPFASWGNASLPSAINTDWGAATMTLIGSPNYLFNFTFDTAAGATTFATTVHHLDVGTGAALIQFPIKGHVAWTGATQFNVPMTFSDAEVENAITPAPDVVWVVY